jgi:serine/threonine protein kinase
MLGSGESIDGRFQLERSIGSGGMGTVYLALDVLKNVHVAVKVLASAATQSKVARLRLRQEIEILSKLHSPHIAGLFSTGFLPDQSPYLVMEYLEGRDLKAELRLRGPLPIAESVAYVVQACRGISVAHKANIVHRDLKPHNLFLTQLNAARILKVLDFGVAKVLCSTADLSLTTTDTVIGTPLYLCPEQLLDSKAISPKSDVWALGVILYELLVGFTPFTDDSPGAVIAAITLDDPVPIRQLRSDIPVGLAKVIERALAKLPNARIASVDELEQLLLPFSLPPDRIIITATNEAPISSLIERPERHHGELDLRNYIKKTVNESQSHERETVRHMQAAKAIESTPPVERLSLLPELRHISARVMQTESATLKRIAAADIATKHTGPGIAASPPRLLARRALGMSLVMVVLVAAAIAISRHQPRPSSSQVTTVKSEDKTRVASVPGNDAVSPSSTSSAPVQVASAALKVRSNRPHMHASSSTAQNPTPAVRRDANAGQTEDEKRPQHQGIPLNL